MSYIQIYHRIGANRAIKALQKAVVESQIAKKPRSQIPQKRHRAFNDLV
ncbi:MAG: hypothetical protein LBP57_01705 [Endomicrobium sp.]|jgi:hypothetical protein|nr:hypothetical protein [Endomicrobium sp.]